MITEERGGDERLRDTIVKTPGGALRQKMKFMGRAKEAVGKNGLACPAGSLLICRN